MIIMFSGWNDVYHAYTGKNYNIDQDFLLYRKAITMYCEKSKGIQKYKGGYFYSISLPKSMYCEKSEGTQKYYKESYVHSISPPKYGEYQSKALYLLNRTLYACKVKIGVIAGHIKSNQLPMSMIGKNTLENIELVQYVLKKHKAYLIYCLQPSLYTTSKSLTLWEKKYLRIQIKNI